MSTVNLPPIQDVQLMRMLQESSVTDLKGNSQIRNYIQALPEVQRNMVNAYIAFRETGQVPDYNAIKMTQPQGAGARNEGFSAGFVSTSDRKLAQQAIKSQGGSSAQEKPVDPAIKAREDAINTNKEIDAHNAPIQKQLSEVETKLNCLDKLLNHIDAKGDGVLTWDEVNKLAMNSGVQEVRDAANWLLQNRAVYESLPKRWTASGGEDANGNKVIIGGHGAGREESAQFLANLRGQVAALRAQLKPHVPVPELPSTQSNGQVGGGSNSGGTSPNVGGPTSPPPPLSTTPGLVGLGEGIDGIQKRINELMEDTKKNPGNANKNQAEIGMLSQQLTALTALMNQIFTMQSNLSKLFSEMSMTAIRNMR